MRKFLIAIGVLLFAGVGAALAVPSFIDWNSYKTEIEAQVQSATGRALTLGGDLDVSILPRPSVHAEAISFANADGADQPQMAQIGEVDVAIALFPLLSGRIQVAAIEVSDVDILLEAYADGRVNWQIGEPGPAAPEQGDGQTSGTGAASPAASPNVAIDDLTLRNVRLTYVDHLAGSREVIEVPELTGMLGGPTGPVQAEGQVKRGDLVLDIAAKLGTIENGRATPLSLDLSHPGSGLTVSVGASLHDALSQPRLNGDVQVALADAGQFLASLSGQPSGDGDKLPITLKTEVVASAEEVRARDLVLTIADERLEGQAHAKLSGGVTFEAGLSAGAIDLDRLLPRLTALSTGDTNTEMDNTASSGAAAEAEAFEIPADMNGKMDVRVEAVTYRGEVIRQLALDLTVADGAINVSQSAELPAAASISSKARFIAKDNAPFFTGQLSLDAPRTRTLADWLVDDLPAMNDEALGQLTARVPFAGNADQIQSKGLSVKLDGATLTGDIAARLTGRPKILALLKLDQLNGDLYVPKETVPGASGANKKAPSGSASDQPSALAALTEFDADISFDVGLIKYAGEKVTGLATKLKLDEGTLSLDGSSIQDAAGMKVTLAGGATDLAKKPKLNIDLNAKGRSAKGIMAMAMRDAGWRYREPAQGDFVSLTANLKGMVDDLTADANLSNAAGGMTLKSAIKNADTKPVITAELSASAADYVDFVRGFGFIYQPEKRAKGPLALTAKLTGNPEILKLDPLSGQLGPSEIDGVVTIRLGPDLERPQITADIKSNDIVVEHYVPASSQQAPSSSTRQKVDKPKTQHRWSTEPIDLSAMQAADAVVTYKGGFSYMDYHFSDLNADLVLKDGVAELKSLTGKLFDGPVTMKGILDGRDGLKVNADLDLKDGDMSALAYAIVTARPIIGLMAMNGSISGSGKSMAEFVASLNGGSRVDGKEGALNGIDTAKLSAAIDGASDGGNFLSLLTAATSGGSTPFRDLNFWVDIKDGVLTTRDVKADIPESKLNGNLTIDLPNYHLNALAQITLDKPKDAPPVGLSFKGPIDDPSRKLDTSALRNWAVSRAVGKGVEKLFGGGKDGAAAKEIFDMFKQ